MPDPRWSPYLSPAAQQAFTARTPHGSNSAGPTRDLAYWPAMSSPLRSLSADDPSEPPGFGGAAEPNSITLPALPWATDSTLRALMPPGADEPAFYHALEALRGVTALHRTVPTLAEIQAITGTDERAGQLVGHFLQELLRSTPASPGAQP